MINPNLDARYPVLLGIRGPQRRTCGRGGWLRLQCFHPLPPLESGLVGSVLQPGTPCPSSIPASYTFTVIDGCVYNAYTNGTGEIISGRVLDQIGRPVINASVTATRTGGGTYTTTTDTQGIYALARIPSASSYSITITKTNYSSASTNLSTGTSSDMAATSGNRWGDDLTMNMLTTVIDHLVWGAVASTQALNIPFGVTITAQNVTNGPATSFTGPVALSASASGLGSSSTIIGNLGANGYLYRLRNDARLCLYARTPICK